MLDTGFDSTSGFTAYFRGSALLPGCRIRSSRSKFLFSTDLSLEASMLDTGNFNRRAYEQIEQCLPYAVNAQFKVEIRPGDDDKQADADWSRLVRMFADSGYRGYLALEYEAKEDAKVAVPQLTRKLNSIVAKTRA
jgi:hypothetical protein